MTKSEVNKAGSKLEKESTDSITLATSVDEATTGSAHTSLDGIVAKSKAGETDSKPLPGIFTSFLSIFTLGELTKLLPRQDVQQGYPP